MTFIAVGIGAAVAVGSAAYAGQQQKKAQSQALAAQENAYGQQQSLLSPYSDAGKTALTQLAALNAGNYSGFESSPDYQFAKREMADAVNTRAAANGQLYSGATSVDMARKISGLASQNLGNYRSSLMSLAGQGQSAAGASAGYAGQMGQAQANSALARGETNAQMAGAVGGALSNLGGALSTKFAPASTTTGTGTNFGQFAPNQTGNWSGASSSLLPSQNYYGFRSYF